MKKLLLLVSVLFIISALVAQSNDSVYLFSFFKNNGQDGLHLAYSNDGYTWTALNNDSALLKPTVAKDRLMRDPCIIRGADGKFHMVWTVSWNDRGIGYASSADLVHWSEQQFIPVMAGELQALNCWAPEITYDAAQKEYMIYWATTIPGRFAEGDTAGDGKYNHRIYYVTTNNFTSFSKAKVLYDQGFNAIDATIQPDGNRYIMFVKDETRKPPQKNIRVSYSNSLTGPYGKPSAPITGNYWAEGPTAIKINGRWIVYFDKYTQWTYGAVSSTDLQTWTDISDTISFPKGARHGTVFTVSRKEFEQLKSLLPR
jgi:hypothetical protein